MFANTYRFNKKIKYKCDCIQKPNAEYLVSGYVDDFATVATLPHQWTPVRSGPILAKYLNERKENHLNALKNFEISEAGVNDAIELKIRDLAETLLCQINNNQCDIDNVIKAHDSIEGPLPFDIRHKALKNIEKLISERLQDINDFKEQALKQEKQRSDGLRKVLHDNFHAITAIGEIFPKDLLKQFDEKIYEINQQLLSNHSAYNELEIQLKAQANQSERKARTKINRLCLGVMKIHRGHSAPCDNDIIEHKRSGSANITVDSVQLLDIKPDTKELDVFLTRLTDEYRIVIANLYDFFFMKLNCLYNHIGDRRYIKQNYSCLDIVSNLDQKLDESIRCLSHINLHCSIDSKELLSEYNDCIGMVKKGVNSIGNKLKDIFVLLHEASHLWDAHMIRVAHGQKLTLAAVEELVSSHDVLELANEVTFNVALEQLVTANDVTKLNQCFDVLVTLLNQKRDEYISHNNAELERLNEFLNLQSPLSDTVLAEFDLFFNKHPIPTFALVSRNESLQDTGLLVSSSNIMQVLSREISQTEFQETALCNWRNGFLENFENNLQFLSEKLEHQIRLWVRERSLPLIKRHYLKMTSLDVRKERMVEAKNVRFDEIVKDESCLQSHLGAIDELINNLPVEVTEFISLDSPVLYPICQWVNKIETGITELEAPEVNEEVKNLKMMSYDSRLAKHRRLFQESLDPTLEIVYKYIKNRVRIANLSNIQYVSSLKLFNENGRLSAIQAIEICSFLVNGNQALDSCMHRALDSVQQHQNEIISQVDKMINPLRAATEATLREAAKNISNRNKQQRNKKK